MKNITTKPRGFNLLTILAPDSAEELDAMEGAGQGTTVKLAVTQIVANTILKAWRPKLEEAYFELTDERPYVNEKATKKAYEVALSEAVTDEDKAKVKEKHANGDYTVRSETDTNYLARVRESVDPDQKIAQQVLTDIGFLISSPRESTGPKALKSQVDLAEAILADEDQTKAENVASQLSQILGTPVELTGDKEQDAQTLALALTTRHRKVQAEAKAAAEAANALSI